MTQALSTRLVFATRRSQLALAQARDFVRRLLLLHPSLVVDELHVVTTGDRIQDRPLAQVGGKGLFVKEIEEALLEQRAHFAVHSIKDVPAQLAEGLHLACIPQREDPRDVLVSRAGLPFEELPTGAVVGTSSLRRTMLLKRVRPDLSYVPLRGNVDTRLRKVREGEVDAAVLAHAGLSRLGLSHVITQVLAKELCLPAVGQGALGIECRSADASVAQILGAVHDLPTAIAVQAERGVLLAVEGNCKIPVAAHAERGPDGKMRLRAFLAEADGSRCRERDELMSWPGSEREAFEMGIGMGRKLREG